jgi:calcium/calmodulin-dependent protein kinase I
MTSVHQMSVEEHYELEDEIGQGQYATVHRASKIDDDSGQCYAVKLIDKAASGMSVTDKEIEVMKRICDKEGLPLVGLFEVYETETEVQLVLELLEGYDLFDRIIKKQKYSEAEAKILMKKACEGVAHLHEHNVIHRDLKPENILLVSEEDDTDCKVADFGLAKMFPEGGPREQKTGTLCGTPGYVAPEVLLRENYDNKVDTWSLGVIMYITCCGFPPFPLDMQSESVKKVKTADFSFPSPYWDDTTDDLKDLIKHMIVVDPSTRYSMAQVLAHPWFSS